MSDGTECVDDFVEPAPVGILRAAAWSVETLAGFGSDELARLALDVGDLSGRTLDQGFLGLWRETVARERQLLWSLTADEPRFLKALLFSNTALYRRVRRSGLRRLGPPTKPLRKLEFTLYRYLARAVGRTTPMGLWAGVSTVTFAAESRQRATAARYAIAPDLRPFQILLRALATREPYRETAVRTLNPTLHASGCGGWEFWARGASGEIERRRIDHEASLETLIEALSDGIRGTLTDLSRRVLELANLQPGDICSVRRVLEALAEGGALVGGLDLPSRFGTPWEALEAEAQLAESDRRHWSSTCAVLREICATLADGLDHMTVDRADELMCAAAAEVQRLAQALGVALPAIRYPFLRCDLGVPSEVSCNAAQRRRLLETVRTYESCWIHNASPWTAWRRARHAERLRRLTPGASLGSLGGPADERGSYGLEGVDAEFRARLDAWQSAVCVAADEVVTDPTAAVPDRTLSSPLGCLYVGLQQDFALDVRGLSDDAATSFARFETALGSIEALTTWLSQTLRRMEAEHGIELAELTAPFEPNPNALARPTLDCPSVDPWGSRHDAETLVGAEFRIEASTRLPFLRLRCGRRPVAVFSFSSAHLAAADPVARQLLETSFHEAMSGNFQALTSALPAEIDVPRYAPRVRLPCGAVIRRRRTVIDGASLRQLAVRSPWQRYIHWQHLAAEYGWPELLNVSFSGRAALPMKRSSPLALDALFKGIRECGREDYLVVEEFPAAPWLKDLKGERYVADLALPFARRKHGWSPLRGVADRDVGGER